MDVFTTYKPDFCACYHDDNDDDDNGDDDNDDDMTMTQDEICLMENR